MADLINDLGFQVNGEWVRPDKGLSRSTKFATRKVAFGDGYEQRYVAGLNAIKSEFSVSIVNRPKADIDAVVEFLNSHAGVTSFDYYIPHATFGREKVTVISEGHSVSYNNDTTYSLTTKFTEVFEP